MDYALRAFLPADAAALSELTALAIRETARRAYSPEQVTTWAQRAPAADWFVAQAAANAIIRVAAAEDGTPAAYVLLEADGHLNMLYCHPQHGGRGLGAALLAEAEAEARTRGLSRLFTEASELARPVFARAGYALLHRRDFTIGPDDAPVAIHNYAMERRIG